MAIGIFIIDRDMSSVVGVGGGADFLALSGQAVLNGVVMLCVFQQLQSAGMSVVDAVREGSMQRLRTVLMAALGDRGDLRFVHRHLAHFGGLTRPVRGVVCTQARQGGLTVHYLCMSPMQRYLIST